MYVYVRHTRMIWTPQLIPVYCGINRRVFFIPEAGMLLSEWRGALHTHVFMFMQENSCT